MWVKDEKNVSYFNWSSSEQDEVGEGKGEEVGVKNTSELEREETSLLGRGDFSFDDLTAGPCDFWRWTGNEHSAEGRCGLLAVEGDRGEGIGNEHSAVGRCGLLTVEGDRGEGIGEELYNSSALNPLDGVRTSAYVYIRDIIIIYSSCIGTLPIPPSFLLPDSL